jgi:hypothetical protein
MSPEIVSDERSFVCLRPVDKKQEFAPTHPQLFQKPDELWLSFLFGE